MSSIIVWDVETVPDIKGFAAANGHDGKSNDEVRAEMGDKALKHIYHYHSIICIGALAAHREDISWKADALGAPHVGERPEKALISSFVDRISEAVASARRVQRFVIRPSCVAVPCHGSRSCRAGPFVASLIQSAYRGRN